MVRETKEIGLPSKNWLDNKKQPTTTTTTADKKITHLFSFSQTKDVPLHFLLLLLFEKISIAAAAAGRGQTAFYKLHSTSWPTMVGVTLFKTVYKIVPFHSF